VSGGADDRCLEVTPSQFSHESEGLALVRAIIARRVALPRLVQLRVP